MRRARFQWLFLACLPAVAVVGSLLASPAAQDASYSCFADGRRWFGVDWMPPNSSDVLSNLGFLLSGLWGLRVVGRRAREPGGPFAERAEAWPYAVFFAGVAFTCAGSMYYHWAPDNARLFWDRLPMTVAFAGLVAGTLADRAGPAAGRAALWPLVLLGTATAVYWRAGMGLAWENVLPYAAFQAGCVLAVGAAGILLRSRYGRGRWIVVVFATYAVAKVAESHDQAIWQWTGFVSGHTLKHLVASAAVALVALMLVLRRPETGPSGARGC